MYLDTATESRPLKLTSKEFLALEELVNKRLDEWKRSTPPEVNETKSPPPSLDDILVTDLCDRIKELESWREGVDPGQLHSQFPITNIIAIQNRVASIEGHITDLSATVTQHKAEQDNLDKIASPRHKLISRLAGVEDRLADLTRTVAEHKQGPDNPDKVEGISYRIAGAERRITAWSETTMNRIKAIENRMSNQGDE